MLRHMSGSILNAKDRLLLDWKELKVTKSLVFVGVQNELQLQDSL
jgi:hypothetical protein